MATIPNNDYNVALATRYFTLTGIVLLLHDHATSLGQERRLIWRAPRSFINSVFLFNRYLVPPLLILGFCCLSGFAGFTLSNDICWAAWVIESTLLLVSLAIGNGIVTNHVVRLWDNNKTIQYLVWGGYTVAYLTSAVTNMAALADLKRGGGPIVWIDGMHSCVPVRTTQLFIPAWTLPLVYEITLLITLMWNTVDRPRQSDVTLSRSLRNDGLLYILVLTLMRVIQLSLVATQNPGYFVLLLFFFWAVVTITLSRSFLSMRQTEALHQARERAGRIQRPIESPELYIGQRKHLHWDDASAYSIEIS